MFGATDTLNQMIDGYQRSALIFTAVKLELPSFLAQPRALQDVASRLELEESRVRRLMNALIAIGVCEREGESFALTPVGRGLLDERTRDRALLLGQYARPWFYTEASLREGRPSFESLHGEDVWSFRDSHALEGETFDRWMRAHTEAQAGPIASALKIPAGARVLEVGAGRGGLKAAVKAASPGVSYFLFDRSGSDGDPSFLRGDMFESVPDGYDVYVLKSVLHDWRDVNCVKILSRCARAMGPSSKLLVVERKFRYDGDPMALLDMHMMNITGGEERTPEAYVALFAAAGLRVSEVRETENGFLVFEVKLNDVR